jgi:hypothetical protein
MKKKERGEKPLLSRSRKENENPVISHCPEQLDGKAGE